ncbi:MAG: TrkA C-terminal domain-containing protein [Clostridiaceae bacterium]
MLIVFRVKIIKKVFDKAIEKIANRYINKSNHNKLHTLNHYNHKILAEVTILNHIEILDKALDELNLNHNHGILILNVEHKAADSSIPLAADKLQLNDIVLVFGSTEKIREVFKTF